MARRPCLAALFVVVAALVAPTAVEEQPAGGTRDVVVLAVTSDVAAAAVRAAGGIVVGEQLDVVGAVAAQVPVGALGALAATVRVVPDVDVPLADDGREGAASGAAPHLAVVAADDPAAGTGVRVALIDSGVADVPALAGRVERVLDLTGDDDGNDRYGHGTFMAGLIAGDGTGAAPGAEIVSLKVAGADGDTDLSSLLTAMQWVYENAAAEDIDVLSLSFGVTTPRNASGDPLARAVEVISSTGVTVVAASGNEGPGVVTSPGTSWSAITVGATDTAGTETIEDDVLAPWSGSATVGPYLKPDVVAPGVGIVSLRAPGSTIDLLHPEARVGEHGFRGNGTSMATALVAGAAASVLAAHPDAAPAEVKSAIIDSADDIGGVAVLDVRGATRTEANGPAVSRGEHHVGTGWAGARWAGARWAGARWAGARWADEVWNGARWAGARWAGARWAGARWAGARWAGARWAGARWAASDW